MDIHVRNLGQITIVDISGDIDSSVAAQAQKQLLPLLEPECKILVDMSGVGYMSSAGLRFLLSIYRRATDSKGKILLVGLSEEIREMMEATGFLRFFTVGESVEAGLAALK